MKRYLLFVLLLLLGLNTYAQENGYVTQIISDVKIDSLMKTVKELSGNVPVMVGGTQYTIVSRYKNSATNNVAANYIKQRLQNYGLTVYDQNFSSTGRNVYAVKQGQVYPDKKYIICAHYDDMPSGSTAPGADDNASGVAAVIEAARLLKEFNTEYTVVFALFDEEEQGLIGSDYFANQAYSNNEQILGVFNADMIAYDGNGDGRTNIHTKSVGNSVALANTMVSINTNYSIGLLTPIYNPGDPYSDHASFWYKGYSAILLIEDDRGNDFHPYYHTVNDRIDYFNLTFFEKCSKLMVGTLTNYVGVQGVVPVELISFNSVINESSIELNWSTATETNNQGFDIEKSNDNLNWRKIGFVEGNSTTTQINNYSFNDNYPSNGINYYRLIQHDYDGTEQTLGLVSANYIITSSYQLAQNYPNPFNPSTVIRYSIPSECNVSIKVFDILGNEITELVNEDKSMGSYEVEFNSSSLTKNISSGVYFYRLTAVDKFSGKGFVETKRMMMVK